MRMRGAVLPLPLMSAPRLLLLIASEGRQDEIACRAGHPPTPSITASFALPHSHVHHDQFAPFAIDHERESTFAVLPSLLRPLLVLLLPLPALRSCGVNAHDAVTQSVRQAVGVTWRSPAVSRLEVGATKNTRGSTFHGASSLSLTQFSPCWP